MSDITPHKGGRNERIEIRIGDKEKSLIAECTDNLNANISNGDKKLSRADVLIYAFNLLWGLNEIEIHARVHGFRRWAYKSLGEGGITVIEFGDLERLVHNSITGEAYNTGNCKWASPVIAGFVDGDYLDMHMTHIKEDLSLFENIQE